MRTVTWLFPLCVVALILLLVFAGHPPPAESSPASLYRVERDEASRAGWTPSLSVVQRGTSIVFSHLGDGPFENRFLQTTLLLANNTPHSTSGTIEFFSDAGTPLEMTISGTTNSTFSFQIPSGGMKRFVTSGTGALKVGWAHVHSQQPITGMASFGVRDARGTIYSDVGVAASEAGEEFTLFADMIGQSRTGLAVANPTAESIALQLTLLRANGTEVASRSISLSPWGHAASFLDELFRGVAGIDEFEGSVRVASEVPFCGLTLRQTGDQLTSMPMVAPEPTDTSWTRLALPHIGDGSGSGLRIRTSIILINNTASTTTGNVEFIASAGTPLSLRLGGVQATSFNVSIPPYGVKRLTSDGVGDLKTGWARVNIDQSIRAVGLFAITDSAGRLQSEVGVESPFLRENFRLIADSVELFDTGIALVNPEEGENADLSVTVQLNNSQGQFVASKQVTLGAQEHTALFFTEMFKDVAGIQEFEGTLKVSGNAYIAPLCLRQAGTKLTSAPLLGSTYGFAPRALISLTQNLQGQSPPLYVNLIQNANDFALQRLTLSSSQLEFDPSRFPDGSLIAFGYFVGEQNTRTFEVLAGGEQDNGFVMQSFDGEEVSVQGTGQFTSLPGGGMAMDLVFSRKSPYSFVGGSVTLHFIFGEDLLHLPSGTNRVEFRAEYESVSIKPDRDERILLQQTIPLAVSAEDTSKPALLRISPRFVQPGGVATFSGNRLGTAPLLAVRNWQGRELLVPGFPGEGGEWRVILPPGMVSGSIYAVNGTSRSNPYTIEVLFSPSFSLDRGATQDRLEIRYAQSANQFPVSRFEVQIVGLPCNLGAVAAGTEIGQGSLWVGDLTSVRFLARSAAAAELVADVVKTGSDELVGELTLSKSGSDELLLTFVPEVSDPIPYISSSNQYAELLLTGLPVTWPAADTIIPFSAASVSAPTKPGGDLTMLKAVQSDVFVVEPAGE
ncbi:MAG: hypothetical protein WAO20_13165 [Acidobacteriota bacterium]